MEKPLNDFTDQLDEKYVFKASLNCSKSCQGQVCKGSHLFSFRCHSHSDSLLKHTSEHKVIDSCVIKASNGSCIARHIYNTWLGDP